MKSQKFFALALGCLLLLETPFTSMAASVPSQETVVSSQGTTASFPVTAASSYRGTSSQTLNLRSKATVYLNNPIFLTAAAVPEGKISWKSSARNIVSVNQKGKLTPKSIGTATVTASCNGVEKSCQIVVKQPSIQLQKSSLTLYTENTYSLKASARPSSSNIKWKSSNSKIATVDKNGTVAGAAAGTATITASISGAKAECQVTVLKNDHELNRTSQILVQGSSTTLYLSNVSSTDSVSFKLSGSSNVANISSSGNECTVTAKHPGTVTLNALCTTNTDGRKVTSKRSCDIKVIEKGIAQQQIALAIHSKKNLTLENIEKPDVSIENILWSSSHPEIADVNPTTGTVTGERTGTAEITATVTYSDKTSVSFPTTVRISNPQLKTSSTVLSIGKTQKLKLTGTSPYSTVKWKIKKSSLATIDQDGTVTAKNTTGKTTISVTVDGKTINHDLIITNPQLPASYQTLTAGKKTKIKLNGISSKSKITYKSKKSSIAKVSKSGVITAGSCGNTDIIISADGNILTLHVSVASKRALKACKKGYKIINSSTYSQARRMSAGYYDCSALVFRAYDCDAKLLGGSPSWAPTAASMASYLERAGKVISYKGLDASKLVPGDLIFYRNPRGSNGRYRNIYHVSMYYGDGYRLEKPLRYYGRESNIVMIARPLKK